MDVLFLTQIIPYPPDAGPKVKTWHVLRYLVEQGHRVTLAAFMRPEEEQHAPALRELCDEVHTVPMRRSRFNDGLYWLKSHVTGRPFLVERDDLGRMHALVRYLLSARPVDVLQADQLTMAQFAPVIAANGEGKRPGAATVFDAHNAVWTIVDRMWRTAPAALRPILGIEARRVKLYEGNIVRRFDHTLAVSTVDRNALLEAAKASANGRRRGAPAISVVPIAVDTSHFKPVVRRPGSMNILTLGTLHYPPNADGIRWFAREVFPLVRHQVPEATLTIVGKNPPRDLVELGAQAGGVVEVTGYVPDLQPYMEKASILAVPVRAGGGMRVRILEAFARAMPVVTTTVGLEGIEATPGEHALVADTPGTQAAEVVRALQDPVLQARLAVNGRWLVESKYDWQVVLRRVESVYEEIAHASRT